MVIGQESFRIRRFEQIRPELSAQLDPIDAGDRIVDDYDETDTGRSNFVAFLLGGVVIAGGLLAFLYYDSDTMSTRDITTGSIVPLERSAPAPDTGLSGLPLQVRPTK